MYNSVLHVFCFAALLHRPTMVVQGWGTVGHEVVANVAWRSLSNATRSWVVEILALNRTVDEKDGQSDDDDDSNSPLGQVADWADRVRHFLPWSAPLHYIDIRDDLMMAVTKEHKDGESAGGCHISPHLNSQCHFVYNRDCTNNTCVAGAIMNYTQQLVTMMVEATDGQIEPSSLGLRGSYDQNTLPSISKGNIPKAKEALMFLTHFIGDIHQPLHCSRKTDKGGNDFHVHFNLLPPSSTTVNRGLAERGGSSAMGSSHHHHWNLHSVWDTGLIDVALERQYNQSRTLLEDDLWRELELESPNHVCNVAANQSCTSQWGQESWNMAIRFAYTLDDNSTDVSSGAVLDEEYYETRWPMAKQRLAVAAVRLAATIEWIANQDTQQVYGFPDAPSALGSTVSDFGATSSFLDRFSWNARMMVAAHWNF